MKSLIAALAAAALAAAAPAPAAPAPAAPAATAAAPAPPAPDDVGQDLYNARCAACHGRDGKGKTPIGVKLRARDLTAGARWKDLTNAAILKVIDEGTPDKGMPSYRGRYSASETAALVAYLLAFKPRVY